MKPKILLLGDEALALGALHAGLSGVYSYPGTPSTEITEFIRNNPLPAARGIHTRWCTNEKTAMEAALGMSFAGKRSLVCMKHVGLNVAADAFINSAMTGVHGGLVLVSADDPSMHSSQNEQDNRFYGKFAMVPILEPSNQQECYDIVPKAFELSEKYRTPVILRMVTRLAHSRAAVEIGEPSAQNPFDVEANRRHWVLLPAISRGQYVELIAKQPLLEQASLESEFNSYQPVDGARLGVVASGIGYNYVRETGVKDISVLKISQYPLPGELIRKMASECGSILVVEDGQPFIEEQVRGILGAGYPVEGRLTGRLPRTGELNPDCVAAALGVKTQIAFPDTRNLVARPPALCQGCGHRDVYNALHEILKEYPTAHVFGDIGCYTLGFMPPFSVLDSCVDMGASITMAKGAADAGVSPAIAIIGDSTFTHSGMTGLLDAANENSPITVIISDNLTTAMTGGQDSAGTSKFEAICVALGVAPEHVRVVVPTPAKIEEIKQIIREEIAYQGTSVIIPRRECMQTLNRKLRKAKAEKQ